MKQQDANKLLAAFMALIMLFSIAAYFISPPGDSTNSESETPSQDDKYNPEYWTVSEPFFSIADGLKMTPQGSVSAHFADMDGMTPQMVQWVRQEPIVNEVDSIYKSSTTAMYYALLENGTNRSFLLLSSMFPEMNDFEYIVYPNTYAYHYLLIRQEAQYNGFINVLGNPIILAPPDTATGTLDIILSLNRTETSYDRYEGLLAYADPAPYQTITTGADFADQFYMGIRENNGSYERTTVYLNMNASSREKIQQLKDNSTERGFGQYNITREGNYTIIRITGPSFLNIISEDSS